MKDWEHVGRLYELVSKDKKFRQFIFYHIDVTIPLDYGNKIVENAKSRCPSKMKSFCRELIKAVDRTKLG